MSEKAMMSTNSFFKMTAIAVAVGAAVVGCGGGSGSGTSATSVDSKENGAYSATVGGVTVSGTVIETPCVGASVTVDTMKLADATGLEIYADLNGGKLALNNAIDCKPVAFRAIHTGGDSAGVNADILSHLTYEMAMATGGTLSKDILDQARGNVEQAQSDLAVGTTSAREVLSQLAFALSDGGKNKAGFARFLKLMAYDMADGKADNKIDATAAAAMGITFSDEVKDAAATDSTELAGQVTDANKQKALEAVQVIIASAIKNAVTVGNTDLLKLIFTNDAEIKALESALGVTLDEATEAGYDSVKKGEDLASLITAKATEVADKTVSVPEKGEITLASGTGGMVNLGDAYFEAPESVSNGVATYVAHDGKSSIGSSLMLNLPVSGLAGDAKFSVDISVKETGSKRAIYVSGIEASLTASSEKKVSAASALAATAAVGYIDAAGTEKTAILTNSSANVMTVDSDGEGVNINLSDYVTKVSSEVGGFAIDADDKFDISVTLNGANVMLGESRVYTIDLSGVTGIEGFESVSTPTPTPTPTPTDKGTLITAGDSAPNSGKYELTVAAEVAVYTTATAATADSKATPIAVNVEIEAGTEETGKYTVIKIDPAYDGAVLTVQMTHDSVCKSGTVTVGAAGNSGTVYALLEGSCS